MQLGGPPRAEADKVYKLIVEKFRDEPAAELAVAARNKMTSEDLHAKVDGKVRMDGVFYTQSAMEDFAALSREQIGKIVMEIALLGQQGLQINNPDVRYRTGPSNFRQESEVALTRQNLEANFPRL